MRKKIFITGGSGLLGSNFVRQSFSNYEVYTCYNQNPVSFENVTVLELDLTDKKECAAIEKIKPDCIFHCAAMTNVDYCEKNPEVANKVNVDVTAYIAETAKKIKSQLVFISTDGVFDGVRGNYNEQDITKPVNIYGFTKKEAEEKVLSICPWACVVRTNIYGWNKIKKFSLVEWIIDTLVRKKWLSGFKDAYFSPLLANDLASLLIELYERNSSGIIHIASSDSCSKFEFACSVAEIFGLDFHLIKPVSIEESSLIAKRGKDLSLNVDYAERIISRKLPTIRQGLLRMKELKDGGYVHELRYG